MKNRPRVLNKHVDVIPDDSVYIGRPSKWGNPFVIGKHGSRDAVIGKFEEKFLADPEKVEMAKRELRGKSLVCFCAPHRCHGDVLLQIANS